MLINLAELNNFLKKTARLEIQTNSNQNLFKTIIWYEFRGWNLSHCTTFKTSDFKRIKRAYKRLMINERTKSKILSI